MPEDMWLAVVTTLLSCQFLEVRGHHDRVIYGATIAFPPVTENSTVRTAPTSAPPTDSFGYQGWMVLPPFFIALVVFAFALVMPAVVCYCRDLHRSVGQGKRRRRRSRRVMYRERLELSPTDYSTVPPASAEPEIVPGTASTPRTCPTGLPRPSTHGSPNDKPRTKRGPSMPTQAGPGGPFRTWQAILEPYREEDGFGHRVQVPVTGGVPPDGCDSGTELLQKTLWPRPYHAAAADVHRFRPPYYTNPGYEP